MPKLVPNPGLQKLTPEKHQVIHAILHPSTIALDGWSSGWSEIDRIGGSTSVLSVYSFGIAIDLTLDGKFIGRGIVPAEIKDDVDQLNGIFESLGWSAGSRLANPQHLQFVVSDAVLDQWATSEKIAAPSESESAGAAQP